MGNIKEREFDLFAPLIGDILVYGDNAYLKEKGSKRIYPITRNKKNQWRIKNQRG